MKNSLKERHNYNTLRKEGKKVLKCERFCKVIVIGWLPFLILTKKNKFFDHFKFEQSPTDNTSLNRKGLIDKTHFRSSFFLSFSSQSRPPSPWPPCLTDPWTFCCWGCCRWSSILSHMAQACDTSRMKIVSSALDHPPTLIGPHTSSATATATTQEDPLPFVVAADVVDVVVAVACVDDVWGLLGEQLTVSSLAESKLSRIKI